jgi:hypothetical protein
MFGPSGSGKTYSALRIASGLGDKIAIIDTEAGSASKYADIFTFDVAELTEPTIDNYCQFIEHGNNSYDVLIIDSMTHGWQELLEEIDKLAHGKYNGNTWRAWNEGTPKQKKLVRAILTSKCHIIATMRSKTEWTTSKDERTGKVAPVRVGLTPEQGKGIEYEFDMLMEISTEHIANVIKDRTGKFQDSLIDKPGEDFGQSLRDWLNSGADNSSNTNDAKKPVKTALSAIEFIKKVDECNTEDVYRSMWSAANHQRFNKAETAMVKEAFDRALKRIREEKHESDT